MKAIDSEQIDRQAHHDFVAELYQNHSKQLRDTFYTRCHDAELASDVTHEVFRRLLEQATDSVRKPLSWLRRVGSNLLIDRARRAQSIGAIHRLIDEFVFHMEEPWQHTRDGENQRRLAEALSGLRLSDQEILRLRYWHDCSSAEIGDRLQLDTNAVDMRLSRARIRLARQMSRDRTIRTAQCRHDSNETFETGEAL